MQSRRDQESAFTLSIERKRGESTGVHHDATASELTVDHLASFNGDEQTLPPSERGSVSKQDGMAQQGRNLGDYEIVREIARGGMGVVYQARQISLNRIVALKMILSGQLASDDDVKRFYIEAESAAGLDHPSIVPIYEIGSHKDQHFFSMGYVDGPSLAVVLKDGPLPPRVASDCLARICDAIQYAHDHGVIHRDLKPGNILLSTENFASGQDSSKGRSSVTLQRKANPLSESTNNAFPYLPKVTDFGLAKQIQGNSELTGTGQILGTPSYMPPEQADGRLAGVGPVSDVYSLGAILYCMLTGRPPFQSANPIDTLMQVIKEPPIAPRQLNPSVPRDLETICLRAIEKSPAKRYASAAEMMAELNRYLIGEPILARPISVFERSTRWLWRHPGVAVTGAVLVAALVSVFGVTYSANRRLQAERDIAIRATAESKAQRALAEKRLDKAIEAVDQMMVRTASERWATRPELQEERQRVLEDAVAFYSSFGDESDQETRIRIEAGKAQLRVSEACLLLNDMASSLKAAEKAATIYRGLSVDFPKTPSYLARASESASMIADIHALTGKYDDALGSYAYAVELAQSACNQDPDNREYQVRSVDAKAHQVYFLLALDNVVGKRALPDFKESIQKTFSEGAIAYAEHLVLGFALSVEGSYSLSSNDIAVAAPCYEKAWSMLEAIKELAPPDTRQAAQFQHTRATVSTQRGLVRCIMGKSDEEKLQGLAWMQDGILLLDQMLLVNPKAFPYRLQKVQTLRARSNVYRFLKENEKATEDERSAMKLIGTLAKENPDLAYLSGFDSLQQTMTWVEELRTGNVDAIETEAEAFLKIATPSLRGEVKYNVVCGYAVVAARVDEKREAYAAKAVSLLNELKDAEFFSIKARFNHLIVDADLDSLRHREDFKAFLDALSKADAEPK